MNVNKFVFYFYVISIQLVDIDHLLFDYRFLNEKLVEVESKAQQLQRQEERITELESELSVYSENHRMISEQLRESEMKKHELDQQVKKWLRVCKVELNLYVCYNYGVDSKHNL